MAEYLDVDAPIGEGWDERICMRCGDEIEPDHESVTARFDASQTEPPDLVGDLHTWCALRDGFRLTWPLTEHPLSKKCDSPGCEKPAVSSFEDGWLFFCEDHNGGAPRTMFAPPEIEDSGPSASGETR